MNIFAKIFCRVYQGCFYIAMPLMPYREPKKYDSISDIEKILDGDFGQFSEFTYEVDKPEGSSSNFSQYLEENVQKVEEKLGITETLEQQRIKNDLWCVILVIFQLMNASNSILS